ncbi:Dbp7p [Cryptosporidium bovis]|uniref:Dbp7p n=1 Tax=Cryptosporidium bovis TaxID=310047 RepID=UPI00351A44C9|nr:Dbp7p [Cryptosporidium bovis]
MGENLVYFPDNNNDEDEIANKDESIYCRKFSEIKELDRKLVAQLEDLGYVNMTRVQDIVIPKILNGGDILLRAPTGTGKTICFLVPAIQYSLLNRSAHRQIKRSDGTIILILTPTRELCIQTMETASKIMKKMSWCVVGSISGGEKRKSEKARLRKGITILGGTPGRILDHIDSTSSFNISNLCSLIVDEADRLLEEGFLSSYKKIYQFILNSRNNTIESLISDDSDEKMSMHINIRMKKESVNTKVILVSATLSKPVEDLAKYSLKNNPEWLIMDQYKEIDYKFDGESDTKLETDLNENKHKRKGLFSVPVSLRQECVIIHDKFKIPALISLLLSRTEVGKRTVVFVSSTQVVEFYFSLLQSMRWPLIKLIRGGVSVKNSIKDLENYKQITNNKDLKIDKKNLNSTNLKNKKLKYKGNKNSQNRESDSDSEFRDDIIISDSEYVSENKKRSKRSDNNNFQTNKSNKWVSGNTHLVQLFDSLFGEYIFKNTIFDEENEESDYYSDGKVKFKNKNALVINSSGSINQPPIFMLHGHMNKDDRIGQLNSFENNKRGGVLITSDVASRGLNFPKIDTVIQLDPPQSIEEYIHRVGRTARMGDKGTGIIFLRPSEEAYLDILSSYNIASKEKMIILSESTIFEGLMLNNCNTGKIDDISGFYYSVINKVITLNPSDTNSDLLNKARRAYIAYIRSYLSYDKEFSKIFSIKKLHLGHVASSFGINEQPSKIIGHIKYLDGVISFKERMNIENKSAANKSVNKEFKATNNKQSDNRVKSKKRNISKTNSGLNKTSEAEKPKYGEKRQRVSKEFEFKTDPNKTGLIDKALMLMKNKSEIYRE